MQFERVQTVTSVTTVQLELVFEPPQKSRLAYGLKTAAIYCEMAQNARKAAPAGGTFPQIWPVTKFYESWISPSI
jgi:hypothetical protein